MHIFSKSYLIAEVIICLGLPLVPASHAFYIYLEQLCPLLCSALGPLALRGLLHAGELWIPSRGAQP